MEAIHRLNASRKLIENTISMDQDAVAAEIEKVHALISDPSHYNNEQALCCAIHIAYYAYPENYLKFEEFPAGDEYEPVESAEIEDFGTIIINDPQISNVSFSPEYNTLLNSGDTITITFTVTDTNSPVKFVDIDGYLKFQYDDITKQFSNIYANCYLIDEKSISFTHVGNEYTLKTIAPITPEVTPYPELRFVDNAPAKLYTAGNTQASYKAVILNGEGTITYTSSNTAVATVDSSGLVTAKKAGKVTITAYATIEKKTYSAKCTVTVKKPTLTVKKSSVIVKKGNVTITVKCNGITKKIKVTVK